MEMDGHTLTRNDAEQIQMQIQTVQRLHSTQSSRIASCSGMIPLLKLLYIIRLTKQKSFQLAFAASRRKRYSGHHKATKKAYDQGTAGKEIWRGKCGQRASDLAG